ncbi:MULTISPECIES: hypothetical protein [Paeniglutamicibacter]|uniref:8-oxoguanine DNA glycosylase OGG fold protein n=1 Tax=Paeniglutamicibacter TaxID=1742990 RepID=UPI00300DA32D
MTVPEVLIQTFHRWDLAGRPTQAQSRWNTESWSRHLPEYASFLASLGTDRMDRTQAIAAAPDVVDEDTAVQVFLLSMLWGYGPVGYGPFRTRRVLERAEAKSELLEVAQEAKQAGGLAAFELIADRRRQSRSYLKWLGPAFGTKYIYFLTAQDTKHRPAPVMDAVVYRWFRTHVPNRPLIVDFWHAPSYRMFLESLNEWSAGLGGEPGQELRVDDVEYLIFAEGNRFEDNAEWRESWDAEQRVLQLPLLFDQLRSQAGAGTQPERANQLISELESLFNPADDTEEGRTPYVL